MTTILPKPFLRQIILSLSWFDGIVYEDVRETYDGPLFDYAFEYLSTANHTMDNFILVGHSLGGALSEIVAAQLYGLQKQGTLPLSNSTVIKSFGFSSPGLDLSSRRFIVNIDDLYETATITETEYDLAAHVDSQVGMVQDVDCIFEDLAGGCHFIQNVICTLRDHCDTESSQNPLLVDLYCEYVHEYPGYNMFHVWQNHIRNDSAAGFCYECDDVDMFHD